MKKYIIILLLLIPTYTTFAAEGYVVNKQQDTEVTKHNICKKIKVNDNLSYFVPTKHKIEWESFINNTPQNIGLSKCVSGSWYSTHNKVGEFLDFLYFCEVYGLGVGECGSITSARGYFTSETGNCNKFCKSILKNSFADSEGNKCMTILDIPKSTNIKTYSDFSNFFYDEGTVYSEIIYDTFSNIGISNANFNPINSKNDSVRKSSCKSENTNYTNQDDLINDKYVYASSEWFVTTLGCYCK